MSCAIALNPDFADAPLKLGSIYGERQMFAEAIDQCEQAARLQPGHTAVHCRLARFYSQIGEKARAGEELTQFENLNKRIAQPEARTPQTSPNR